MPMVLHLDVSKLKRTRCNESRLIPNHGMFQACCVNPDKQHISQNPNRVIDEDYMYQVVGMKE
jgi:hypothetical protein